MSEGCVHRFVLTAGSLGVVAAGDENQSVIVGCQIATSRASESQQFVYDDAFILAVGTVRGEQEAGC